MKQAILTQPGKIEFKETDIPVPGPDEVLIKVKYIGICGSDIHAFHGKHPYVTYPFVQGHEFSGEVVETGNSVTDIQSGDKVTAMPQLVCNTCYSCTHGRYNICDNLKVFGFQADGAAGEYFAIHQRLVIRLPEEVTYEQGAMVEPVAVCVHALNRGETIKGLQVLVLGGGPIGNLTAQTAKSLGASQVMMTDIIDFRCGIAGKCNIDHIINVKEKDLNKEIAARFGENKADIILECVGIQETMSYAIEHARKGTDIIVVGVFGDKPVIDMGLIQDKELRIIGTLMYRKEDYLSAVKLLQSHAINVDPLITHHFPFNDYQQAYEFIAKNQTKTMKVMIDL
ncbi:MAG: alcohol dehydrogenase catalytic domain-containing protein [Spirochaetales bacterium]|nr:alcohol dehydrogenase catalytic domain-containing protein [Spirochaetales bacterium]